MDVLLFFIIPVIIIIVIAFRNKKKSELQRRIKALLNSDEYVMANRVIQVLQEDGYEVDEIQPTGACVEYKSSFPTMGSFMIYKNNKTHI